MRKVVDMEVASSRMNNMAKGIDEGIDHMEIQGKSAL